MVKVSLFKYTLGFSAFLLLVMLSALVSIPVAQGMGLFGLGFSVSQLVEIE